MNQMIQIQQGTISSKEDRIIVKKGLTLTTLNHVLQRSNPNIFVVKSQTTPKFYRVLVDCDLDIITCDCKYFQTKAEACKQIIACCFYMGGSQK